MAKDLSNQRFGKLIALKPLEERENGSVVWECRCDCGNLVAVSSRELIHGRVASCKGCSPKPKTTAKDLTGQRFGKLVALRATEERRREYVLWECRCDCGNTAYVVTSYLVNGHTRSCGCLHRESANRNPVRDLTGQRFGRLVVLRPTEERKGKNVVWECRCDCGNVSVAATSSLTSGGTRSCGCLNKEHAIETKVKDLTGQRFGKLLALRPMEERKNRYVVWECKCDCGNTAFVPTSLLTSGNTSSCGCLKKDVRGGKRPKDLTGQRFGMLVAVKPTEERRNGNVMWECKCDCGNMTVVRSTQLVTGVVKSCGCLRKANNKRDNNVVL